MSEESTMPPIKYSVTEAGLATLAAKAEQVPSIQDNKSLAAVQKVLTEVVSTRTGIEKRRKALKADALEYGRKVDAIAKDLTAKVVEIETPLAAAKKQWLEEVEAKRAAAAAAEQARKDKIKARINRLVAMAAQNDEAGLDRAEAFLNDHEPTEDIYEEFVEEAREAIQGALADIAAQRMRIQDERQRQIELAEARRLQAEAQAEAARIQAEADAARQKAEAELEEARREAAFLRQQAEAEEAARQAEAAAAEKDAEQAEVEQVLDDALGPDDEDWQAEVDGENEMMLSGEPKSNWTIICANETCKALRLLIERNTDNVNLDGLPADILDAIRDGKIPHVRWTADES